MERLSALGPEDTITFDSGVYAGYQNETWLRAHIGDELLVAQASVLTFGDTAAVHVLDVFYQVPQGAVLYMANAPAEYKDAGSGEFYVIDPAGNSCLPVGKKHFFRFDKDCFFTTDENKDTARVYCCGWKDGCLLSPSSMGTRKGLDANTDYLHPQEGTFGSVSGALFNGCMGYHRIGRWALETETGYDALFEQIECSDHTMVGSCAKNGHTNDRTRFDLTDDTVIVDIRNGGAEMTLTQFVTELNAADTAVTNYPVLDFISAEAFGKPIRYVVITGLSVDSAAAQPAQ